MKNNYPISSKITSLAFTLAEVLITLAIIGVVAALTIPSVVANAQQQEFKTGLKKAVNVLNDAITMNIANEGETPYENANLFDYLIRHMSVMKTVNGVNASRGDALNHAFYTTDGMRFELLADGAEYSLLGHNVKLHESGIRPYRVYDTGEKDSNGHIVWSNMPAHCGSYGLGKNPNNTKYIPCVIMVDVNGDRKPSIYSSQKSLQYKKSSPVDGRLTDVFVILITEDKAIPFGVVAQRAMYGK